MYRLLFLTLLTSVIGKELKLLILHNNDMHSRFEETNKFSSKCDKLGSNKCFGGFARTAHVINEERQKAKDGRGPPVLYLNAGDTFTGTAWFVVHRVEIVIHFLFDILKPDAASLGNHEFDDGLTGLIPYLQASTKSTTPIVTANIEDATLADAGLKKSTILTREGYNIGVIGYLTPQTEEISQADGIKFTDEVEAINREAEKLKKQGIKTIIALGHSGYEMDKHIAKKCPLVDLVIGGHTNTFLWNGPKPSVEDPEGPYPTMVKQKSGKEVPVVQAFAYTKYMGRLFITIDTDTGKITSAKGDPLLLDSKIPQDPDVLEKLKPYKTAVQELDRKIMGKTKVYLEGRDTVCRKRECNLGNLITDALINFKAIHYSGSYWTDAAIAIINSGAIRSSIDAAQKGNTITYADMVGTIPFNNDVIMLTVTGKQLKDILEFSVHSNGETSGGEFLQYSGVQVEYDRRYNPGNRVISAKVRCAACSVPIYEPIDENKDYNILVNTFLAQGGDGYKVFKYNSRNKMVLSVNEFDGVVHYVNRTEWVYPAEEGRIIVHGAAGNLKISILLTILGVFLNVFR